MSDIDTLIERCEKQIDFMDSNIKKYIQMMEKNMESTLCSEQLGELFAALAKAQAEMTVAEKNVDNAFLKSTYADLASMMKAARPHLSSQGLAVIQLIQSIGDVTYLVTRLGHSSGQWMESRVKIETPDKKIQSFGSALTYLRRYSYSSICGIAPGNMDDDDGEKAMNRSAPPPPARPAAVLISADELKQLEDMIGEDKDLLKDVLSKAKLSNLAQLPKERFQGLMNWLDGK